MKPLVRRRKEKSPPLKLRLVVVHDGTQAWYLVTSILAKSRFSDADVPVPSLP